MKNLVFALMIALYAWSAQKAGAANGDFLLYDVQTGNIQQFTNTGTFLANISTGAGFEGFAIEPSGDFVLYDVQTGNIQRFTNTGTFLANISTGAGFEEFAVEPSGDFVLYDVQTGNIQRFTNTGTFLANISTGAGFESFAVEPTGNFLLYDFQTGNIQRFTNTGTFLANISTGAGFEEFSVEPTGDLVLYDVQTGNIQRFTNTGTFLANISTGAGFEGFAVDNAITTFMDIGATAGVNNNGTANGAAWGDFNNDGNPDIYVVKQTGQNNILYKNNGGGTFTNIAGAASVDNISNGRGATWGDYDNDGDLDLYVTNSSSAANLLYRNNGNETFTDLASAANVAGSTNSISADWSDYDQDGDLDLYVNNQSVANSLYRNEGNGSFTNIASGALADPGNSWGTSWADFDNDGDPDLLMTNSSTANRLYRNDGNDTFTDIATTAGVADVTSDAGGAWADFDHDGDVDFYMITFSANKLYQNNGNETFTDLAPGLGLADTGTGSAAAWADADNDGDMDLYATNQNKANLFFLNNNNSTFTDLASIAGIGDAAQSVGTGWADFDNDGDVDLFVANNGSPNRLYQNEGNNNQWLQVELTGTVSNRFGVGTKLTAVTGTTRQRRDINGESVYLSQSERRATFGFGTTATIDSLIVNWPSGIVQTRTNVATNQVMNLIEAEDLIVTVPDTVSTYNTSIKVPIRIEGAAGKNIVAVEIDLAYDSSIITSSVTEITNTLVAIGWSVEENIFPGSGNIDTLSIAMSTAEDTLDSDGDLILLTLQTANIRQPASTALELTKVLFNDGSPTSTNNNGSLTLIGTDGTIIASPDSINPGNVVNITVTDADFDLDVGNPDQVSATAISKGYNDSQSVTLTETGANTGIFTGTVSTVFSLTAGPSNDGVITTIAGDSICVSFVDSLTSAGTTITIYDTVEVIGGVDGEILASFVVQALDSRTGVRDTVRVQVTDSDLDLDVGNPDQVSVTITNNVSAETETVTLTETGPSTGIFQVRVPTIAGGSGTNDDGELSLSSEDTLYATYVDALTSQGGSSPIQDDTQVVNLFGDVRSNDKVQAFDAASILAHSVSLNTYTARDSLLGDVDGNGDIASFDAAKVLAYVVRLIDRFPVQTDDNINPPGDPKNHPFLKPVPLHHIIAMGDPQPQGDGTYRIPLSLADRQDIVSTTLEIAHNKHTQILNVTADAAYEGFMVAHNAENNRVRIGFAGAQSQISGSGNILYLHIKTPGPLKFSIDRVVLNGQTLTPSAPLEVMAQTESPTPQVYALHQNHPNPFNPETIIRYDLPEPSDIRIVIYNIMGQQIRTLISDLQETGAHQVIWNAKDELGRSVGSGIYFLKMEAREFSHVRKMLLLR